jgi:hypothetical protein
MRRHIFLYFLLKYLCQKMNDYETGSTRTRHRRNKKSIYNSSRVPERNKAPARFVRFRTETSDGFFWTRPRTFRHTKGEEFLDKRDPYYIPKKDTCSAGASQSVCRSVSLSVGRSVSKSVSQSVSQSVCQSVDQSVYRSVGQSINQSINQSVSQSVGWLVG